MTCPRGVAPPLAKKVTDAAPKPPEAKPAKAPVRPKDRPAAKKAAPSKGKANLVAPAGECAYCDRRREYARVAMKAAYERKKAKRDSTP
jgi:uncharacterized protein involved in type VI secretion and phage assembly